MTIQELYNIYIKHPIVTTDSRSCPKESIFFALKGESFDGNQFAWKALEQGCSYAVVDNPSVAISKQYILVDDVLKTMQALANYHRQQFKKPVIQVTGTNGKTTTKELLTTVLSQKYNVLSTIGNLNNHIGVPKTLLRLSEEHDIAVIETGANHPGEISFLCNIVEPDCGLITNVGTAHLLGFGSFEGVVKTKGELYDYLRNKPSGFIFINANNPHLMNIANGLKIIKYGYDDDCEVKGEVIECNPFVKIKWKAKGNEHIVQTHLVGAYNLDNMLAAAMVGIYFGVSEEQISTALADYTPSNNRSELRKTEYNQLIIDAYNANPTSMNAALENFSFINAERKMVILGEMLELGDSSDIEHEKVIRKLMDMQLDEVWLVGKNFKKALNKFHNILFKSFENVEEVKQRLIEKKVIDSYILIKGSNGTRLFMLPEYL